MKTTIRVNTELRKKLMLIKINNNLNSIEEVIKHLLKNQR
jgi:hypothetical protein